MPTAKMKNDDNKEKNGKEKNGQKSLTSFFTVSSKGNAATATTGKENKENNMGLDSNLRKSSIKKCKEFGTNPKKKNTQRTIDGNTAEGRCDEGTKVCKACEYKEKKGKAAKFAHDPTCEINANYKFTNGGRISMADYYLSKYEEERMKNLKRPFSGKELCTSDMTQEDVDDFFAPRPTNNDNDATAPQVDDDGGKKMAAEDSASDIYSHYDTTHLIARINHHMKMPTFAMKRCSSVPMVVSAGIQSLFDLVPIAFKKGTNQLRAKDKNSITYKKLQAYRKRFPPGTVGFTFPRGNKSLPPDYYYTQLEGRTIYFVCWELNIDGWEPKCHKCGSTMIHDRYDFQQHGYATPIFNISGVTDYACSMYYNCKKCDNRLKANDGRMLVNVPLQFRNGYPVDPRYAVNKETHLALNFSRVMDKMFVTHGNGDQLSLMLNELRGDQYLDVEEEYFCQAITSGVNVARSLPSFEYFIGKYSPGGWELRDLKDFAAESDLVTTGVSDKDRVRREMQSVRCNLASASDHTFEFRKNYQPGLLPENACGHTIGTNTGEIASLAIVKDTKQTEYAHQAEQCSLRPGWKPKVHTTDNCPSGIALWKHLLTGVHCQLGLFHYTYRITKTLNKECRSWKEALSSLQTCMYYYEANDLENVKQCLKDGVLGKSNGKPCPEEVVDTKARTYRDNVRIWTYDSQTINRRLAGWITLYKYEVDDNGEELFTQYTEKTVVEQMKKSKWVVDKLSKDELYLQVEPSAKSRTGLKSYIGARGTESKLEKGHHAIAHFANGGMRHSLADFLGMGGLALYNLRIRYRLKVAKMQPAARSKIPVAFQRSPHFTNHLRLSHNNEMARKAGLNIDVHKDVEILQPDNGERFFYEYFLQHQQRVNDGIGNHADINRCMCRDCGKNNPYRKRKPAWETQDDVQPHVARPTPIPPPLMPLQLAPTLLPLPAALRLPPSHFVAAPVVSPPWQPALPPTTATTPGPYSMLMSTKKKRNKKKQA